MSTKVVASRTFCCCIPVRAGVILIGFIGLVGGGAVTAVAIMSLKHAGASKTAIIIQLIVYLLLALVSLLGIVGAITRKRSLIRLYFATLLTHLLFSLASGIYAIHRSFKDAPKYLSQCTSGSTDHHVIQVCKNGSTLLKAITVSVFIVAWLLEIWGCVIVINYSKQLVEEEVSQSVVKDTETW
ncbi:hypothetical protein BJ165DRAFT_1526637 [Panaeolus papilionaceus]|nr:hypothetical protein BJ165DRAFT_1526637 [Panaeolus papilionaceus]